MAKNKQITLINISYMDYFKERFLLKNNTTGISNMIIDNTIVSFIDRFAFMLDDNMWNSKAVEEGNFTVIDLEIMNEFEGITVTEISQIGFTSKTHVYNKHTALDLFNYIVDDVDCFSADPIPIISKKLTKFMFIGR